MEKNPHEIPEIILDQLIQSKVNGFPFFAYTGIKQYNLEGEDTLYLKNVPSNPNHITSIQVVYDFGMDVYKLYTFQKNQRDVPFTKYAEVYFDELAQKIAKDMGVL